MKYRLKNNVIEAIKWTGDNVEEVAIFQSVPLERAQSLLQSTHTSRGDYIMRDIWGDFRNYPPEIFEESYELITDNPESIEKQLEDNLESLKTLVDSMACPLCLDDYDFDELEERNSKTRELYKKFKHSQHD